MNNLNDNTKINQFLDFMKVNGVPLVTVDLLDWLVENGFFMKPATNHHGNYTGGLFDHSFETAQVLVQMTEKFDIPWTNPRSPYIVGMFHDLCKMDDYIDENVTDTVVMGTGSPISKNPKWKHNPDTILNGHGDKSIMMLSQFMTLTQEEILCIKFHMGADDVEWNSYVKAIKKHQSVLFTHTADMYASIVTGV